MLNCILLFQYLCNDNKVKSKLNINHTSNCSIKAKKEIWSIVQNIQGNQLHSTKHFIIQYLQGEGKRSRLFLQPWSSTPVVWALPSRLLLTNLRLDTHIHSLTHIVISVQMYFCAKTESAIYTVIKYISCKYAVLPPSSGHEGSGVQPKWAFIKMKNMDKGSGAVLFFFLERHKSYSSIRFFSVVWLKKGFGCLKRICVKMGV